MLSDEDRLHLLRALEHNPSLSQRALSRELNISLGKVNYCLSALIDKGWVKVSNFRKSDQKLRYLYALTPTGIEQKSRLTVSFLQRKLAEYDRLEQEIAQLRQEVRHAK
jgi:EPS-associated MarR family transcriptional regulator